MPFHCLGLRSMYEFFKFVFGVDLVMPETMQWLGACHIMVGSLNLDISVCLYSSEVKEEWNWHQ